MNAKVKVMPGVEGIKQVYENTLGEKKVDFVCTSQEYDQVLEGWYENDYSPRLEQSGVEVREVLSGEGSKCIKSDSEGDVVLAEDWVALVSFDKNKPFALLIEDRELVKGFADRFEALWN